MSQLSLSPAEARVVAALVEKSITTPQYYPMTVNAIMLAANQKSCRNPAMNLTEGEVGAALNRLERDRFCVRDDLSGRTTKWRHQFQHQLLLKPAALAVLVTLMLRGPQTASELRANASALGGPADAETLTSTIQDLIDRNQPLVTLLQRVAGQKEARYAHLLCGAPTTAVTETPEPPAIRRDDPAATESLAARLSALEARVAELERRLSTGAGPES
jgi:hypothetical protein